MFFKEDHTFRDIQEKSLLQWLDEMEIHEDIAVRSGVRFVREYISYLEKEVSNLEHKNVKKEEYLKKYREKMNKIVEE